MKRYCFLSLFCLFFWGCLPTCTLGQEENLISVLDRLRLEAKFDSAIQLINNRLGAEISLYEKAQLQWYRSVLNISLKDYGTAESDCQEALAYFESSDEATAKDILKATLKMAQVFRTQLKVEETNYWLSEADLLLENGDWKQSIYEAESLFIKGYLAYKYSNLDEGINYLQQSKDLYLANKDTSLDYFLVNVTLGQAYSKGKQFEKAEQINNQIIDEFRAVGIQIHPITGSIENSLGNAAISKGEYSKAIYHYQNCGAIFEETIGKNNPYLGALRNNIGIAYMRKNDFYRGLANLQEAIRLKKQRVGSFHPSLAITYLNVTTVAIELEQYQLADSLSTIALQIIKTHFPEDKQTLGQLYNQKARIHRMLDKQDESILFHLQSIRTLKSAEHSIYKLAEAYQKMGNTYFLFGQFDEALRQQQKALTILEQDATIAESDKDNFYSSLARSLGKLGRFEEADKAWENVVINLPKHLQGNISDRDLLESQYVYGLYLEEKADYTQKQVDWSLALDHYLKADSLLKNVELASADRAALGLTRAQFARLFEGLIHCAFQLHEITGQKSYQEVAFHYMERAKSRLLMESLQIQEGTSFLDLPDELLQEEQALCKQIIEIESSLTQLEAFNDSSDYVNAQRMLFENKQSYFRLIERYKKEFPNYYKLRFQPEITSLTDIQKSLSGEEAIISYYVGDWHFFITKISKNGFELIRKNEPGDLLKMVEKVHQNIESKRIDESYIQVSYELYQLLLGDFQDLPEKLIIIPDQELWYLPFETLLSNNISSISSFKDYPFLLKAHTISYNYSASLLLQMENRKGFSSRLLAVAPTFQTADQQQASLFRADFGNLLFNREEANKIAEITGGKVLLAEAATKKAFLKQADQFGIFHFATHASVDADNQDFSFLAFANAELLRNSNKISVQDLYGLSLPAQMVVLSACQTGIGPNQRGEGLASLARGFAYAGAKSIIPSLWKVNDLATSEIMVSFYEYLKEGIPKDEALQKAKLDFINRQVENDHSHPFYWASFVALGDMERIHFSNNLNWIWPGALIILGFITFIIFFLKRTKKN